jgi:hypothetical protein
MRNLELSSPGEGEIEKRRSKRQRDNMGREGRKKKENGKKKREKGQKRKKREKMKLIYYFYKL